MDLCSKHPDTLYPLLTIPLFSECFGVVGPNGSHHLNRRYRRQKEIATFEVVVASIKFGDQINSRGRVVIFDDLCRWIALSGGHRRSAYSFLVIKKKPKEKEVVHSMQRNNYDENELCKTWKKPRKYPRLLLWKQKHPLEVSQFQVRQIFFFLSIKMIRC